MPLTGSVVRRLLGGALLVLAALSGCRASPKPDRVETYPLVTFGNDPAHVLVKGHPTGTWITTESSRRRAIVGSGSFAVALEKAVPSGATLETSVVTRGAGGGSIRISIQQEGEALEPLWEESIPAGSPSKTIGVSIPAGGPTWIRLEAEADPALTVAFVEPTLLVYGPRSPDPAPDSPSIVLVTIDTLRQDDLAIYGGPVESPALARLAAEGMVFEQVHAVALGTTPSHCSLLTASPARRHGVYDNSSVLPSEQRTLAEVLRGHGWDTAAFVSSVPLARGLRLDQGFDLYDDATLMDRQSGLGRYARHERRADGTIDQARVWLETRTSRRPFFLWVHLFDPHQPYAPPDRSPSEGDLESLFVEPTGSPKFLTIPGEASPELAARIDREARSRYRGEIAFVDQQLDRLFHLLEDLGVYDSAIIAVVGDHGESFLDRGRQMAFRHTGLHGEITRLPLLLKAPRRALIGRTSILAGNQDLAPTILDLADLPIPRDWEGASLLDAIAEDRSPREHLLIEGAHHSEVAVRTPTELYRRALIQTKLSTMGYQEGPVQIFDLRHDPGETEDRGTEPGRADALARIADRFLAEPRNEAPHLGSEELEEGLEALGYVQ